MLPIVTNTIFSCIKQGRVRYSPLKITFCPPLETFIVVVFTYVEEVVERSAAANIDF